MSIIDNINWISQILEKKINKNEVVRQLFIDCKKARREVLYNMLFEFVIPMKMVRLIKCVWMKRIAEAG